MKLVEGLPNYRDFAFSIFGAASLQLTLDSEFHCDVVDIVPSAEIESFIADLRLGRGECYPAFVTTRRIVTSPFWACRGLNETFGRVRVCVAGPLDVLVGKVWGIGWGDLKAFDLVREKTGGPSEDAFRVALQNVVDMYRPLFPEESHLSDPVADTRFLWQYLYGHDIDVREEIILPALRIRSKAWGLE